MSDKKWVCPSCKETFETSEERVKHWVKKHGYMPDPEDVLG